MKGSRAHVVAPESEAGRPSSAQPGAERDPGSAESGNARDRGPSEASGEPQDTAKAGKPREPGTGRDRSAAQDSAAAADRRENGEAGASGEAGRPDPGAGRTDAAEPGSADGAGAGAKGRAASGRPAAPEDSGAAQGSGESGGGQKGGGADGAGPAAPPSESEKVSSDEPLLPARVHRPIDLIRFFMGALGIALVLVVAGIAKGTTSGLEADILEGTKKAPALLISFAGFASSIAVLIVPVAFAIERLIKRDGLRVADGVLAAVLAHGVSLATDLWVAEAAPESVRNALTQQAPGSLGLTDPVHGYLAPVIAYMTAVGLSKRPRWRVVLWFVLILDALAVLLGGYTTPFSIILTLLIGWTVAYGTLYAVGSPNVQPTGQTLLAGLRRVGFSPVRALRVEDGAGSQAAEHREYERGRRYLVELEAGAPLDVTVVDRERQASGFFYRVWRRLQLRGITQRRSLQSLRQALEQEALLAYAAIAAGANAPKLIATSELGPDAVMLVYEHIGGRSLDAIPDEEIGDELLTGAWKQVKALQSRRIAHRRLVGESLLVDRSGAVFLTELRGGEIAAGDLVLRMDIAQFLVTLALRVGPERAVASASAVLGPDSVANSLPLLQPIALSRETRATLRQLNKERAQREREAVIAASRTGEEAADKAGGDRKAARKAARKAEKRAIDQALEEAREEDLLSRIRQQVLLIRPQAPVEPVRLERIRPRTLISVIAGAFAAYFLLGQISQVKPAQLFAEADWGWALVAVFGSALSYVAAALALAGFVPERLSFGRTVLAQVAGSFVKLVAPAAVGGVALNTRYLQRSGVRPGLAVASVGASQLVGLGFHILLLLTFGYLTGTEESPSLSSPRTVIAGLLTAAVLVLVVTAVPQLRKFISTRVRSLFAGVVPRMLDVLQRPSKLATGLGGSLLLTVAFVICLDGCIRAFGGELSYASIAFVFLAGNALGSAAPTPGGVGAVELALSGGLIAAGLPKEIATPAVLLFRLLTFWLPVLPGWLSFTYLQRKEAL
ncbi:lysylphosphatidylglycerol synthase transmembrane domain-containing protein [Wenjunlia tyrosinilytica]|uniref:lysylphosphatidylglycerol synthase transmembrane domain-containing protein n=1 Tax=Wenjunlia tyrosinilytica TaxID=1544741 RepID=UPI0016632DAB|nr:lysylphosphatidylglycerol synthase transmembrane domain-containing protein [Wenjunlia tyrosinilytica]